MVESYITVKNLADYLKLDYSGLAEEEILELAAFFNAAETFIADYVGLTLSQIDEHESLTVAIYVSVQDMYDNRTHYVDKNNLDRVVLMSLDYAFYQSFIKRKKELACNLIRENSIKRLIFQSLH